MARRSSVSCSVRSAGGSGDRRRRCSGVPVQAGTGSVVAHAWSRRKDRFRGLQAETLTRKGFPGHGHRLEPMHRIGGIMVNMTAARMGLYYPYVHIADKTWLKAAALYWPKIARIVPSGYPVNDSSATRTLIDELGFVVDISPDSAKAGATAMLLEALGNAPTNVAQRYKVPPNVRRDDPNSYNLLFDNWVPYIHRKYDPQAAPQIIDEASFWLKEHGQEMEQFRQGWERPWPGAPMRETRIPFLGREVLIREKFAFDVGPWLAMHPKLSWVYMSLLAKQLAELNHLIPITDSNLAYDATSGWTPRRIIAALSLGSSGTPAAQDLDTTLGLLAVQLVLPKDLSRLPIQKVIRIRQHHGADFDAFHDAVAAAAIELGEDLAQIPDAGILKEYLDQEIARRFKEPLAELHKAFRGFGLDTALAASNIKFTLPTTIATGFGFAEHQPIVAAAGAVAFGVLNLSREARKRWSTITKPSAASYLWRIERGVTPQSLLETVMHPDK
jgi:Family of unknown function (DUF6236)